MARYIPLKLLVSVSVVALIKLISQQTDQVNWYISLYKTSLLRTVSQSSVNHHKRSNMWIAKEHHGNRQYIKENNGDILEFCSVDHSTFVNHRIGFLLSIVIMPCHALALCIMPNDQFMNCYYFSRPNERCIFDNYILLGKKRSKCQHTVSVYAA